MLPLDLSRPGLDLPSYASLYPFESFLFPFLVSLYLSSPSLRQLFCLCLCSQVPSLAKALPSSLRLPHPLSLRGLAGVLFLGEAFLGLPAPTPVFLGSTGTVDQAWVRGGGGSCADMPAFEFCCCSCLRLSPQTGHALFSAPIK